MTIAPANAKGSHSRSGFTGTNATETTQPNPMRARMVAEERREGNDNSEGHQIATITTRENTTPARAASETKDATANTVATTAATIARQALFTYRSRPICCFFLDPSTCNCVPSRSVQRLAVPTTVYMRHFQLG